MNDTKPMLTVAKIAEEAGVSRMTVYRWIDSGILPTFRFGGSAVRISQEDWDQFKSSSRVTVKESI